MLCIHICMYISEVGRVEVVTQWLYRKNWAVKSIKILLGL
jgi:hypothetical protein